MSRTIRRPLLAPLALVLAAAALACRAGQESGSGSASAGAASAAADTAGTVLVVARDYAFQAPDSLPSGWTTFRFRNRGKETHFMILDHLPDGKTYEDYRKELTPVFDSAWAAQQRGAGVAEAGKILAAGLPAWFADFEELGGVGLVAPGDTTRVTEKLVPGTYVLECYMKGPDGTFHRNMGMERPLYVTDARSGGRPPEADIDLTLRNDAIVTTGRWTPGAHTVRVAFAEQPATGEVGGNDVHVARLEEGQSASDLAPWMYFMNPEGMRVPAPARFLGGVEEMPAGDTAYFTVDLTPGRYALLSEVSPQRHMYTEFTVEP
ncbi:MAG TPA: hypothetical protein VKB18_11285 [Gemmatimonadota bacterium]|nr:hypothetical protein [Gemmatimonadota bacterium]